MKKDRPARTGFARPIRRKKRGDHKDARNVLMLKFKLLCGSMGLTKTNTLEKHSVKRASVLKAFLKRDIMFILMAFAQLRVGKVGAWKCAITT